MPEAFDRCVKAGGRVRTISAGKGKYRHVCYKGGKAYAGYIKTKKTQKNSYSEGLKHEK